MKDTSLFWDNISEKYAKSTIKNMPAYEQTLDRTRSYLKAEDRALEIGCGTSNTAVKLAPSVREYVASDYSRGMVDIGQKRAAEAGLSNLRVVQGAISDPQFENGSFDHVLGFNLFHLVPDDVATFKHVHRVLKPGGLFISKTPCLAPMKFLFSPMIGVMKAVGKAPHVTLYGTDTLEAAIVSAGFEVIEYGDYPARKTPSRFLVARKV